MKPIRLICYIFFSAFFDMTVHNVQPHSDHLKETRYHLNIE